MKLKQVLILAFVFLTVLPMYLSFQYLNYNSGEQYRSQVENNLEALSLIAKKRILADLERINDRTLLIANRTLIKKNLSDWNLSKKPLLLSNINKELLNAKASIKQFNEIALFDISGKLILSTSNQKLFEFNVRNPTQIRKEASRSGSNLLVPIDPFQLFLEKQQLFVINTVSLVVDNLPIGYLSIAVSAESIIDLINDRTGLGRTGEWLFAVRHGSGDALFVTPIKYDEQAAFNRRVSKSRFDIPITQAMLGNELIVSNAVDYKNESVIASTRYLPKVDWGLVAKIRTSEIENIIEQNSRVILFFTVFAVIFSGLSGICLSFYISRPIENLREHTIEVAKGNFEPYNESSGWSEVRELAKNYNAMVANIEDYQNNLNRKVEERTREFDEANKKLQELSIRDPLTGLYNRRYLNECLSQEVRRAKRYKTGLTIVIFDIDYFKRINDQFGHAAGDDVLVMISAYLKKTLRVSDLLARYGGEEFCLAFPGVESNASIKYVERIRKEISELECLTHGEKIQITCSFGLVLYLEGDETLSSLLERADNAMYQAKAHGRNHVFIDDDLFNKQAI